MLRATLLVALLALPVPAANAAAPRAKAAPAPAVIGQVIACRSIADATQRLACFDRQVANMANAQASGDLVAMDRQQVRRTKRSLFGISLPDLGVFGDDSIEGDESQLETTIRSLTQN